MRPWAYAFSQYALGALGRMIYTSLPFVTCLPLSPSTLLSPWVQQAAWFYACIPLTSYLPPTVSQYAVSAVHLSPTSIPLVPALVSHCLWARWVFWGRTTRLPLVSHFASYSVAALWWSNFLSFNLFLALAASCWSPTYLNLFLSLPWTWEFPSSPFVLWIPWDGKIVCFRHFRSCPVVLGQVNFIYLSPSCVFLVFCLCLCAVLGTENFTCLPLVVHFSLFFPTSVFVLLPPWSPACFPIGPIAFALPLFFFTYGLVAGNSSALDISSCLGSTLV